MTIPNIPEHVQERHLMNREDAAEYVQHKFGIRCSPGILAKRAHRGTGPAFRKFGREILYSYRDIDRWVMEGLAGPFKSTSEYQEAAAA